MPQPKIKKMICNHFRHNELPQEVLPSDCRGMQTSEKTRVSENRKGVEQDI